MKKCVKLRQQAELTVDEADRLMFEHTKYEDMPFIRETTWDNYDKKYASPVFKFKNGDRVVFDHYGVLRAL